MGSVAGEARHAVSIEGHPLCLLRVAHAVNLLNQAGLGTVIGERQLHRHRARADHAFEVSINGSRTGQRIDLVRYVAWLADRIHGAGDTSSTGDVTLHGVLGMLERQQYRCAISGRHLTPDTASLDHRIPVSRGGPHRLENAQVLHADVNRAKASLTNDEFIALCREVVAWADRSTSN